MIELVTKSIFFDVGIDGKKFASAKFAKTFGNIGFSQSNGFYFGSSQNNSGREFFDYFVIESGSFIKYVDCF